MASDRSTVDGAVGVAPARALAMLDAARRGRPARHERARAPHRHDAEHGLAPARHARRVRPRRARRARPAATGSASASCGWRTPCSPGSTCAPSRARTWRSSSPRPARRRRSRCPAEEDAVTVDFVASAALRPARDAARPARASRTRPRPGRSMLAFADRPLPPPPLRGLHAADDHRPGRARRASSSASAGTGYAEAIEEREPGLNAIAAPVFGSTRRARGDRRPPGPDRPLRPRRAPRGGAAPARAGGRDLGRPRLRRVAAALAFSHRSAHAHLRER